MHNYRKRKAQENVQEYRTPQASMSTDPTQTHIIYNYKQANKCFQNYFIGKPFGYACDICDR
jgi:hypothetical protein